jgi:hypothetical protein
MSLTSALESGPHLVLSSAASILQTSTEIPHNDDSNSRPESTIFENITISLLQSPIVVPSPPSQLESNIRDVVNVTDYPAVIRLIRLQQAALWLVALQVTLLVTMLVTVMLHVYLPK